jgi:FAD-dependent oxidoreductase domain-containing protein 1
MPQSYDVVIVGGAVMGSSSAYHLAADRDFNGRILVIDKDLSFQKCASALSAGSIRQQYSTRINIQASLFGLWFIRNIGTLLEVDGERLDVGFRENGYLYLATEQGRHVLETNNLLQLSEGADIQLLDRHRLQQKFPWMQSADVALGSWGATGEGWFDGYTLMQGLRRKARSLGVAYMQGHVVDLEWSGDKVIGVRLENGETIACGALLNTCGASGARQLAAQARFSIPVSSRKRSVFSFTIQSGMSAQDMAQFPLLIDTTGVWVRREGSGFLTGVSPPEDDDPERFDYDVDWPIFDNTVWPALAERVPAFESIKPGRAWAGHYDLNTFDHNAIVGRIPGCDNAYLAAGFSGHGLQQSPAVGRGLAELIAHGRYVSLDLSDFGADRIVKQRPLLETNVI